MKREQIGIQLYTLRDFTKTVNDFADTIAKVAKIGYRNVQISAVDYDAVPESEVVKICADHGLVISATHERANEILEAPEKVVDRLNALGTKITAYPNPAGIDFTSEESVSKLIAGLENAGIVLRQAGQILTYHNHHHEFRKLNGKIILERIYEETSPENLQAELDTYWVQYGGGDPVRWCEVMEGRCPIIHLKDYRINNDAQIEYSEVGSGNLDFKSILLAAEKAGCRWFVVEQDRCPGNPFDSIRMSYDYLAELAED